MITVQKGKVIGGIILTLLWMCCFLFIKPTLVIDYGGGVTMSLQITAGLLGLLIVVLYHIFYRSDVETTKLSLTAALTIVWLALIIFYPFNPPANFTDDQKTTWPGGAIAFFTLVGGLAVCVLWVRFFSDEIF